MGKDEYYEEKQIGLTTYYRLYPAFDWHEMSNKDLTKKINELQADLEIAQDQLELALKEIKSIKGRNVELLYDYVFEAHRLVKKST